MFFPLRESALTEEFDYNFIKYALREYKHPRVKINDLLKKCQDKFRNFLIIILIPDFVQLLSACHMCQDSFSIIVVYIQGRQYDSDTE
ncbi:MAG: hypothetical protein ABRQ37_16670 [Candidatus Eremiobacterota bacterium]